MTDADGPDRKSKISLAPLAFEEALAGLLQTEPPPKADPSDPGERPKRRPRKANPPTQPDDTDRPPKN